MTTTAEAEILTRTGPGTPMGEMMRQYWIPAAASGELVADGDPVRLMLLGEKLIAFRDSRGSVGVMDQLAGRRIFDAKAPDKRGDFIRQPEYEVTETPCGTAYGAYHPTEDGGNYWRVAHFLFPFWTLSPTGPIDGHVAARLGAHGRHP